VLLEHLRNVQQALAIPMLYVTHSPAEALALGSRLFLLESGRIAAEGSPLDALSPDGPSPVASNTWENVRNVFTARVAEHAMPSRASMLDLDDGPQLVVPFLNLPRGTPVLVAVRADDIILSKGPLSGLSARNQVPGAVDRIVHHGHEAEVIVKTGGITWIASVVNSALDQLDLSPGAVIHLIIKARSCQVLDPESRRPTI
jgi:molybdate transport system ATP-binding protein